MKMPPGPQCTVCGREYPALAASSAASIVCVTTGLAGVGFGVEDIGGRRANAGYEQVATLERLPVIAGVVAAMPVVAQRARACVPPEVVQLVARRRQLGPADHAAVRRGARGRSPPRRSHPSPGRPGRKRRRRRVARAQPRRRRPGCGRTWDLSQPWFLLGSRPFAGPPSRVLGQST